MLKLKKIYVRDARKMSIHTATGIFVVLEENILVFSEFCGT